MTQGIAPDIDNYTVPAGQKIFFTETGGAEKELGNIASLDVEHTIELLQHYSNRDGSRKLDKTVPVSKKLEFPFTLDEPTVDNLRYYFAGGAVSQVGAGTATKTDQKLALAGTGFVSVGPYFTLTAVTVRQFLDYVFRKETGGTFHDNSVEADSLAGTPFDLLSLATDEAYLGKATKFKEFYSNLAVNGSFTGLAVKYWNGATWAAVSGLAGAGAGFDADGKVQFDLPVDWVKTTVNGAEAYFLKITATVVTTPATVNCFRQNCVDLTDYHLDAAGGKVARIAAGMLVDGEEIKITFTYATQTAKKFAISTGSFIEGSARIEIKPVAGLGIQKEYQIPLCQIRPNGQIKDDDKEWEKIPFVLTVLSDYNNNPTKPYGELIIYE